MNLRFLPAGVIAGLAVMALDEGLAFLTLGYWVHLSASHVGIYVGSALLLAAVVEGVGSLRGRPPVDLAHAAALSAAILYLGPVIERFYGTAEFRGLSTAICVTAASVGAVGYVVAVVVLSRIAGPRSPWLGPAVATLAVSIGLSLNRNVFFSSVSQQALLWDAVVAGLAFAAVALGRAPRGLRMAGAAIALGACVAFFVQAHAERSTSFASGAGGASGQGAGERPDLVLILIDTLRNDVFREVVEDTPEGRAFAESLGHAAWFNRFVAAAPWTAPSVASIMTGLYPREHGFERADPNLGPKAPPMKSLGDEVTTLAERLEQHGYVTDAIVTNQAVARPTGMARGFQRYELLSDPKARLPLLSSFTVAGILEKKAYAQADSVTRRLASHLPSLLAADAPVFLYLHLLDPHDPLFVQPELPADAGNEGLDELDRLYRDETRFALREASKMLEMWKATPRWDNTLVVVLSDHGELMPSDGHVAPVESGLERRKDYGHGFALYESLVHVPLVMRPPRGLPESRQVDVLASHVDIHNTVVDVLGIELAPLGHDRVSHARWLEPVVGAGPERQEAVSGSIGKGPRQRALQMNDLKLIDYPDGERLPELYDLATDPGERKSLHQLRPDQARARKNRLEAIWAELGESPESSAPVKLTPEMQKQLEALGYIDSE